MAKRGSSWGGWIVAGLVILGLSQCFSTASRPPTSTNTAHPNVVAPVPSQPTTPSSPTAVSSERVAVTPPIVPPAPSPATAPEIRYVTASVLNIRAEPSTSSSIVGSLSNGTSVTVFERSGDWLRITGPRPTLTGWVHGDYTSATRPPAPVAQPAPVVAQPAPLLNRNDIVQQIINRSIRSYSGNCPCPYNRDSAGRQCGGRSAYSRPGGARTICYASDVTEAMIAAFRP